MKKLFTIFTVVVATTTMISCQPSDHKEIRKAFKEYVKTDFDNPKNFVEITDISVEDTICKEKYIRMIAGVISLSYFHYNEADVLQSNLDQLRSDTTFILIYAVKVRVKTSIGTEVKKYNITDDHGKYAIYESFKVDDLPYIYRESLNNMTEVVERYQYG